MGKWALVLHFTFQTLFGTENNTAYLTGDADQMICVVLSEKAQLQS